MMGSGFDEVKDRLEERLPILFAGLSGMMAECDLGLAFDLFYAGTSESRGPVAYAICNHGAAALPLWKLAPVSGLAVAPASGEIVQAVREEIVRGRPAEGLNPAVDGLAILELQRETPVDLHNGVHAECVGGFAQLTTVASDSRTQSLSARTTT